MNLDAFATLASAANANIRRVTPEDFDWMIAVARQHYEGEFDESAVKQWGAERINAPTLSMFRSDNAFIVSHIVRRYNAPNRWQAYLIDLYADPRTRTSAFETFNLVKTAVEWAKSQGATKYWLCDNSNRDLGAFAKRLGGVFVGSNYSIDLDGKGKRFG